MTEYRVMAACVDGAQGLEAILHNNNGGLGISGLRTCFTILYHQSFHYNICLRKAYRCCCTIDGICGKDQPASFCRGALRQFMNIDVSYFTRVLWL